MANPKTSQFKSKASKFSQFPTFTTGITGISSSKDLSKAKLPSSQNLLAADKSFIEEQLPKLFGKIKSYEKYLSESTKPNILDKPNSLNPHAFKAGLLKSSKGFRNLAKKPRKKGEKDHFSDAANILDECLEFDEYYKMAKNLVVIA